MCSLAQWSSFVAAPTSAETACKVATGNHLVFVPSYVETGILVELSLHGRPANLIDTRCGEAVNE